MMNARNHIEYERYDDEDVEKPLVDFLHYIEKSSEDNIPEDCDERLKHLHRKLEEIKANEQMGVTYMKMEERDRLIREEGRKEGERRKDTRGDQSGGKDCIDDPKEVGKG